MNKSSQPPFDTPLLRQWRSRELTQSFNDSLDYIERHGVGIISVFTPCGTTFDFAYTTGIFDTCGEAELIAVGLPPETAHSALNTAAGLLRDGTNLLEGRFADVVGNVEVEFRPADSKWLHHVMLRTDWYYDGTDVPLLQLIFPDLEGRFPWEDNFNERFGQPLLQRDAEQTGLEVDFWNTHSTDSSEKNWKFSCDPHTKTYQTANYATPRNQARTSFTTGTATGNAAAIRCWKAEGGGRACTTRSIVTELLNN